jgi:hypothetical protein
MLIRLTNIHLKKNSLKNSFFPSNFYGSQYNVKETVINKPGDVKTIRRGKCFDGLLDPSRDSPEHVVSVKERPQGDGVEVDGVDEVSQEGTLNTQHVPSSKFI